MAFYIQCTVFFSVALLGYFLTRLGSVKIDYLVTGVLFFAFLFLVALRPSTVPDTIPYIRLCRSMDAYHLTWGLGRVSYGIGKMEVGFVNLCKLASLLSESYQFFFFIVAFLTVSVGVLAITLIERSMHPTGVQEYRILPAFILFVSYYGFIYASIVLRAGLAISFSMLSYAMIIRKRYGLGLLVFLLAFSFHNSIFLFLIIVGIYLILPPFKMRTYRIASIIILVLYVLRVFDTLVPITLRTIQYIASMLPFIPIFDRYLQYGYNDSGFIKTILLFMIEIIYLTFWFDDTITKEQRKNFNALLVVAVLAALLGFLVYIMRIIDLLFIIILPPLLLTLTSATQDKKIQINKKVAIKKQSVSVLGIGAIATANFLLFGRWSGYLELIRELIR